MPPFTFTMTLGCKDRREAERIAQALELEADRLLHFPGDKPACIIAEVDRRG